MVASMLNKKLAEFAPPSNFSNIMALDLSPVVFIKEKENFLPFILDGLLSLLLPIVAYWTYSMIFHLIDVYELAEKYRIHPSEEEQARNKASLSEVVKDVLFQHFVQTCVGLVVIHFDPPQTTGHEIDVMWRLRKYHLPLYVSDEILWYGYMYGWTVLRMCIAISIIDSWQYWLHRFMHMNKTLYRRFHSRHHRLYVPFAFGALYNDPVEGFLLDTLGTGVASLATRLSHKEAVFLYTFATLKTVDDHCGYRLPFDLFQILFPNNALYHDIHHQTWGIKSNFSQPFFTIWDKLLDTEYKFIDEYKSMQKHITLTKYKEFLETKKNKRSNKKAEKMD